MDEVEQSEEISTPAAAPADGKPLEPTPPSSPAPNRFTLFLKTALRWLLGILFVALLGALLVFVLLYRPVSQRLNSTTNELVEARQLAASQKDEITSLENQVSDLAAGIQSEQLQAAFLKAELQVLEASMAAAENNFSRASLAVDQAELALQSLASLLGPEQEPVVSDIQSRLVLARGKLQPTLKNALPDLRTISGDLALLKGTVLGSP